MRDADGEPLAGRARAPDRQRRSAAPGARRRARPALPARRRRAREPARGPRAHASALRRRPRDRLRQEIVLGTRRHAAPRPPRARPGRAATSTRATPASRRSSASRTSCTRTGLTFDEARELSCARRRAFTTHTPVPAGHDRFDEDLDAAPLRRRAAWVGPAVGALLRARAARPGRARALQHDVPGAHTSRAVRQRREPRCTARSRSSSCTRSGRASSRARSPSTSITNGVHLPTWTHPGHREPARRGGPRAWPRRGLRGSAESSTDEALWSRARRAQAAPARRCCGERSSAASPSAARPDAALAQLDGAAIGRAVPSGSRGASRPTSARTLLFRDTRPPARARSSDDRPPRAPRLRGQGAPGRRLGQDILQSRRRS